MAERLASTPESGLAPASESAEGPAHDDHRGCDARPNERRDRLVALLAIALALVPVVCVSAITGYAAWANMVMGALLQGAAIAACGWLAFRRGGLLLCVSILAALSMKNGNATLGFHAWRN
jgi:nitrate reductase NapE component